jgi:CBS domain-containing protein
VFGVPPEASVGELLDFFARTGLHRALVLEGGRVVGIVTTTDLLELIAAD